MLKGIFANLIGNAIVAAGRAIKVRNLDIYSKNNFRITPEQYVVLNMIKSGDYSQNQLCELLFKDKSNVARLISVLETKNLIRKTQITRNGKQINRISLTPDGEELHAEITPIMNLSREKYLEDITEDDMYICIKVLTNIQKNLEKE